MMNTDLVAKYSKPVPRYTSYPPANFFTSAIGEMEYRSILEASNADSPSHISVYVHIPFKAVKKMLFLLLRSLKKVPQLIVGNRSHYLYQLFGNGMHKADATCVQRDAAVGIGTVGSIF